MNKTPQLTNGFVKIANELFEAIIKLKLSPYEMSVLLSIMRLTYGWNKKESEISLLDLSKVSLIKTTHICRTLKKLLNNNIILKRQEGKKVFYQIQKDYSLWKANKVSLPNPEITQTGNYPNRIQSTTQIGNETLPKQDTHYILNTLNTINTEKSQNVIENFEKLWALYPIKKGKKKAFAVFKRTASKKEDAEKVLVAINYYKKEIEEKNIPEQYIKHGATFFNQWEDYYELARESEQVLTG